MSRDIRSYFTTLSSKPAANKTNSTNSPSVKKRTHKDIEDDIIPNTPDAQKPDKNDKSKRRRIIHVSSDSETENDTSNSINLDKKASKTKLTRTPDKKLTVIKSPKTNKTSSKTNLKPENKNEKPKKKVNPFEAFGNEPVKQDKIPKKKTELNIHDDDDFEKTLIDLDEEELFQKAEAASTSKNDESKAPKNELKNEAEPKKITPVKILKDEKKSNKGSISSDESPKKELKFEAEAEVKYVTPSKKKEEKKEKTPARKRKSNEDEDDLDQDQDRYEKKRYSAMLYQKYLNRSGPAHLGAKWIPQGKPDCLKGVCFIITGVLDSMEREEAQNLITEHGGRCTQSVSGKVNYMVLGDDAGPAKVEKARKLGTKMISEDDLIDLICIKSGIQNQNKKEPNSNNKLSQSSASSDIAKIEDLPSDQTERSKTLDSKSKITTDKTKTPEKKETTKPKMATISDSEDDEIPSTTVKPQPKKEAVKTSEVGSKSIKTEPKLEKSSEVGSKSVKTEPKTMPVKKESKEEQNGENQAWVDKYKPKDIGQIIGQQGEKSNMNKLKRWLQDWQNNRKKEATKAIPRPSPWAKDDSGAYFRCALLSGPPGVGKTTTATLVCKHLGFDTVEFNASDTRNKRVVQQEVAQLLSTTSIAGYAHHGSKPTSRHVLLMDEVDGMSGNEDRGGIQELIAMIKKTQVPIICMCNDRQHPKIRTLANYCFDLRFSKPKVEQIRGAMMSICFREHLPLKPDAVAHVIIGTGQDVRQTLNQLSLLAAGQSAESPRSLDAQSVAQESQKAQKDTRLGPWEVIRKVFSAEDAKTMSFIDHGKLFFYDYSIGPLFIQENYLKVVPNAPRSKHLELFAQAADAISMGDVIDSKIRSTQSWSLLDVQGLFASVAPGQLLRGHMGGQIDFPKWLGKNSKAGKMMRLSSEIYSHTRMSTTGDRTSLTLDLVKPLRDAVASPLIKYGAEGIPASLEVMKTYSLLRDDLTSLVELAKWPRTKDPFDQVESKVKAAFTRAYNTKMPALPYAAPAVATKKRTAASEDIYGEDDEENAESDEEKSDDVNNDAMIKMKKTGKAESSKASSSSKAGTSSKPSSRGKASGSGRGRGGGRKAK